MRKLLIILMLLMSYSALGIVSADDTDTFNQYNLDIKVDVVSFHITGTEEVIYHNNSQHAMEEVYFAIYPNAFNDLVGLPVDSPEEIYPNGFEQGYIDVDVAGHDYSIENDIFLKVILDEPLQPGGSAEISISFDIKVPEMKYRFGHYREILYAGNCFPIACVFRNGEWDLYPYIKTGDPFFSETSNWHVDMLLDRDWVLATTGVVEKKFDNGAYYEYEIDAPMVRDYAFSCSSEYQYFTEVYNGTTVTSYYYKGHERGGQYALEYAIRSLSLFEDTFGPYPYPSFSLAETHLGVGAGMEYPQLVFIDSDYYGAYDEMQFEVIVVHETAHQWWYSAVGNDQFKESFIDESLAQFSTALYFENYYDMGREMYIKDYLQASYADFYPEGINIIDLPLDEYASDREYYYMVYVRGPLVLDMVRMAVGDDEFTEFLSDTFSENLFKVITKDSLIDDIYGKLGNQAGDIFDEMITTDIMPDAMPGESFIEKGQYNINIIYYNGLEIPVEVKIVFDDGSSAVIGPGNMFRGDVDKGIDYFVIDPNDLLLELDENNNTGELTIRDSDTIKYYAIIFAIVIVASIAAYGIYKKRNK